MTGTPVSRLLSALASSKSMVTTEEDRATLAEAAAILADPTRTVTRHGEPKVMIVTGVYADLFAGAVDNLEGSMEEALDTLHTMEGNLDDLRRQLRDYAKRPREGPKRRAS